MDKSEHEKQQRYRDERAQMQGYSDESHMKSSQNRDAIAKSDAQHSAHLRNLSKSGQKTTSGDSCFPANTSISTPTGPRAISEFQKDDLVSSICQQTRQPTAATVHRVKIHGYRHIWAIDVENGENAVRTTSHHTFLTDRGLIVAQDLRTGDVVLTEEGSLKVVKTYSTGILEPVFNLHVSGSGIFFAESFAVHSYTHMRQLRLSVSNWLHRDVSFHDGGMTQAIDA